MTHTICLLPGDGIGPEVTTSAQRVIEAPGVNVEWVNLPAGTTALEFCGSVLPERTVAAMEGHGVALKGPLTTPIGSGTEEGRIGPSPCDQSHTPLPMRYLSLPLPFCDTS